MGSSPAYIQIADQIKCLWLSSGDPLKRQKLPTQEELAIRFKVSRPTIIRALSKLVAEGYLHSQQGSGVYVADTAPRPIHVNSSVKSIGLIVPELRAQVVAHACRGVERRARHQGYQVLLASSEGNLEHERELVEQHLQAGASGIVLYPVTRTREQLDVDYLVNWQGRTPLVAMDIGCEEWPCTRVQFDNDRLCYDMTQMLQKHGHRLIAFMHVSPEYLHSSIHDRRKGWEAAMDEAQLPIPDCYRGWPSPLRDRLPLINGDYRLLLTDDEYAAIAEDLLRLDPRPDALIVWNDVVAAHLTQALQHKRVRIPEEIRIAGFDNEPMINRLFRPLFPTSRPDFARLGELSVDALIGAITSERLTPRIYYHSVSLLWREPRTAAVRRAAAGEWDDALIQTDAFSLPQQESSLEFDRVLDV